MSELRCRFNHREPAPPLGLPFYTKPLTLVRLLSESLRNFALTVRGEGALLVGGQEGMARVEVARRAYAGEKSRALSSAG
jgi:hypothetical protein